MLFNLVFAAIVLGPPAGFFGGMLPKWYQDNRNCRSFSPGMMRLLAALCSWLCGAAAGCLAGWSICSYADSLTALQVFGEGVNGVAFCGLWTATAATIVGLVLAKFNTSTDA